MNPRILVIDDEEAIRRLLTKYLRDHGYQAVSAATSHEAEQLLGETTFHLATLDIDLGGEDGLAVLQRIRQAHPHLPVLMLTGMGFEEEFLREALRLGAAGYASKTLALEQLLTEVHRILNPKGTPKSGPRPSAGPRPGLT